MPAVRRTVRRRTRKAFTLLEMMLVVVIIGLLVGVAVLNLTGQSDKARQGATEGSLRTIQNAVISYYTTNGTYPASIAALVPATLPKVFKDAWKQEFVYYVTPQDPARPYALFSMGKDQLANTADDISVWTIGE
jgi:general secretion pathway protein G